MSSPAKTRPRILCVDDRVSSLEVRRALLAQMGYDVLIAGDPATALSIFDKNPVDLVLLDYSFPGQMSGDELAHELRAREPGVPLIMLSGYPDLPPDVAHSVDVVLLKGTSQPSDLLNAIANLLQAPPHRAHTHTAAETSKLAEKNQQLMGKSKELIQRSKGNISGEKS